MKVSTDESPLVSVVIPCYNAECFIQQTVTSVIEQTYRATEIIVVDDGSTDETASIIAQFDHVRYFYQPNSGPAAARNTGLQLSKGEYIAFLDADDLWMPEMLKRCVAVLEAQPSVGAVHANWLPIDSNGQLLRQQSGWQPWRGDIFERLLVHIPFNTSSIVWHRAWWHKIGGFDLTPEVNDDWLNWLRIVHLGCQFEAIAQPLVYRRTHPQGITRVQSQRVVQWRLNALERICSEYSVAESLRRAAYAEIYWVSTMQAVSQDRLDDAVDDLRQAVDNDPSLLSRRSTFFGLACGDSDSRQRMSTPLVAQYNLMRILDGLFSCAELPVGILDQESIIRARALFYLAQIAYSVGEHDILARRLLGQSLRMNPSVALDSQAAPWVARILLGRRLVRLGHKVKASMMSEKANADR
ncbi:MAG: Hyaluronan synthase [Chloroflexi bacterium ADurb.Bin360]|nr:MAG: Hyaluronan synthase [Chloroflexi bacterium ADurb.Bin360]